MHEPSTEMGSTSVRLAQHVLGARSWSRSFEFARRDLPGGATRMQDGVHLVVLAAYLVLSVQP